LAVGGDPLRAAEVAAQAVDAAERLGDEAVLTRAQIEEGWLRVYTHGERSAEESVLSEAERSIPVFERDANDRGAARACEIAAMVHYYFGRLSDAATASERGFLHAERAHDVQQQGSHRLVRTVAAQWGFTPLARVEDMLEDDLAWSRETGSLGVEAKTTMRRALVRFQRGDAEGGEVLLARGLASCSELGLSVWASSFVGCWVWGLTDDPAVAEPRLQESYDTLEAAGRLNVLSTVATIFAECRFRERRYDDADRLLDVAADAGADDDFVTQVRLRAGRAKLLARRGAATEAEAMALDGVALADETEFVDLRGDSRLALGDVLALDGRDADAERVFRSALALWEAKGNLMYANRARGRLAEPVRTE